MNDKHQPAEQRLLNDENWLLSRKAFVQLIALSSVAIQIPWLHSCSSDVKSEVNISPLSQLQYTTVLEVQKILFPDDGNGPGASQINAAAYLTWVLRDPLLDSVEGEFIITRIDKFNEVCKKKYNKEFQELRDDDKIQFVTHITEIKWGKKWLSKLLTFIFEALLLNPAYGGNVDEVGWNWLEHDPGQPRPTNNLLYPTILNNHEI